MNYTSLFTFLLKEQKFNAVPPLHWGFLRAENDSTTSSLLLTSFQQKLNELIEWEELRGHIPPVYFLGPCCVGNGFVKQSTQQATFFYISRYILHKNSWTRSLEKETLKVNLSLTLGLESKKVVEVKLA